MGGRALFVLEIFDKNDTGQCESPFLDISVCFPTTEAYSVRRRIPLIGQSSSKRRHLFETPYSQPTNDRSRQWLDIAAYPTPRSWLFMTFLHLYEGRPVQTCMQQRPWRRSALYCTCTHKMVFTMQQCNVRMYTLVTRAKQGCQLQTQKCMQMLIKYWARCTWNVCECCHKYLLLLAHVQHMSYLMYSQTELCQLRRNYNFFDIYQIALDRWVEIIFMSAYTIKRSIGLL